MNENIKKITVITEPATTFWKYKTLAKKALKKTGCYGGHSVATKNIVKGLSIRDDISCNYRVWSINDCYDHVHVAAGVEALRWGIEEKRKGRIKYLSTGPCAVDFPIYFDSLVASPEVDCIMLESQWFCNMFIEMEPSLEGRCVVCPVGIDIDEYNLYDAGERTKVIVYQKFIEDRFAYYIKSILEKHGYDDIIIIKYGNYKLDDYKKYLKQAKFMITMGIPEHKGTYLMEAWAMDVPTLCFDMRFGYWDEKLYNKKYNVITQENRCYEEWAKRDFSYSRSGDISTCPWISELTGETWYEYRELEDKIENMKNSEYYIRFHPREWIINNMTIIKSTEKLVNYIWEE